MNVSRALGRESAELVCGMLLSAPGLDLGPLPPHTVRSSDDEPLSIGFEALFGLDGVLCVAAALYTFAPALACSVARVV